MSTITKPMLLDETGQKILEAINKQNEILKGISAGGANSDSSDEGAMSWADIQKAVQEGKAASMFDIGDQIVVKWTNMDNESYYKMPFDVVHFGNVKLEDGSTVPGMYLQCHYMPAAIIPFDAGEGSYVMPGMTYESGFYYYASGATGRRLFVEGVDYNVGDVVPSGSFTLVRTSIRDESCEITSSGYNKWSVSAIRQYLNSDVTDSGWWTPQHEGDVGPSNMPGMGVGAGSGFLCGFEDDFLSCIKKVQVCTVIDGDVDITYDKFFIPSLEQMNVEFDVSGEGEAFEYWRLATDNQGAISRGDGHDAYISYRISKKSVPAGHFFRSVCPGTKHQIFVTTADGGISEAVASATAYGYLPVCVIC